MTHKKPSLSAALREATERRPPLATAFEPTPPGKTNGTPTARQGLKVVSGHFDPTVSKQLRLLAVERDTNLQDLLAEAIRDLLAKYQQMPSA